MEIFKDQKRIDKRITQAEKVIPVVRKFDMALKSEGLEPSIEFLEGFISKGPDFITNHLLEGARKDVEKLNITSDKLRRTLLHESMKIDQEMFNALQAELSKAFFNQAVIEVSDIQYVKGKPVLNKNFSKKVEDNCTVNLETEEDQMLWKLINQFCDSFNKLEEIAEKKELPSFKDAIDERYASFYSLEMKGMEYCKILPDPVYFLSAEAVNI